MTPVDVARAYLGTHDGSPFLKFLGLSKGLSWCCAFVIYCFHVAAPANHLPRTARVYTLWETAVGNPYRFEVITPSDVQWGSKIKPNDVIVFSHNPNAHDWLGHTGLCLQALPHQRVQTIEGNTSSNSKGDQRNGGTVAIKVRRAGIRGFWLEGFVRQR